MHLILNCVYTMQRAMDLPRNVSPRRPRAPLPSEVLDEIASVLLEQGAGFANIASVSLVSWQFRQIVLRRYFETFVVRSPKHWVEICRVEGFHYWVRDLRASSPFFQYKLDSLSRLTSLRSLTLDFSADGLSTQRSRCSLLFKNMTADLTTMKLTHLPRIDSALLTVIVARFPSLERLELSCTERLDERCCWLCLEESSSCTVHSPIPDVFCSAQQVANTFGTLLKPLAKLEHLFLGMFLSDADVLNCHLDRCAAVVISSPRAGFYSSPPFGPDKCAICIAEHGVTVRKREHVASVLLGKMLSSLKTIGWSTYFAKDRPGDDVGRKTIIFATCDRDEKVR
ncbi:hypothetical protein C8Q80DRAFT_1260211 [Daedaleopsis nitida]|nr:hypothetical protein C8Q80DRAFT_1260211 [Daedaleopsis nitida]